MPEEPTSRAVELICNTSLCYWQLVDMRETAGQSHLYKLSSAPLNHNPPRTFRHRAERIAEWHKVINHTMLRFTSKQWEYETRAESCTCVNKKTKLKGIKDLYVRAYGCQILQQTSDRTNKSFSGLWVRMDEWEVDNDVREFVSCQGTADGVWVWARCATAPFTKLCFESDVWTSVNAAKRKHPFWSIMLQ